jgi:N-formylglutamate deformylase
MTPDSLICNFAETIYKNSMQKHFKLSDLEFKNQFVSCQLNPAYFSHEAHLRLAWITINEYGIDKAEEEIQSQLLNFINFVGVKDRYNKTVTIAALKAVHHFMQRVKSNTFKDFIAEYPQLNNNFMGLIGSHYSFDIFHSNKAKTEFLEPDLLPFD